MSSVDERIVEMRFDSKQFENGAKSAINILDSLEKALQLDGVSKGLANIKGHFKTLESAAKGIGLVSDLMTQGAESTNNFSQSINGVNTYLLGQGLDVVTSKFSVLGTAADQVIRRITDGLLSAASAAGRVASNLVISPISAGFSQYERETKSVQTLMNATGLGMAEIEAYTQKLGFYVDETSYSYESMFSTLASMMSSGVEEIDVGVDALIGLGNAAGLAGVDATQATHAFEGFGKAIGQGYMDSRNWSWIKTARMDTTALKQAFIDAGVSAGTLVQETDKAGNTLTYVANAAGKANKKLGEITAANMDNFLSQKWLTRDVMLAGVGNYSTAFNQIYADFLKTGDYAEDIIDRLGDSLDEYSLKAFRAANQTRTFTDVVEYIAGAGARRWSTAFKKIFGNFEESSELWASLIDPMYDIFITPLDNLNELLDGWRELGGYEHIVEGINSAFEGLVNISTSLKESFHDIFPEITAKRLFSITEHAKNLTIAFKNLTMEERVIGFVNEFGESIDEFTNLNSVKNMDSSPIFQKTTWGYLMDGLKGIMSGFSLVGKAVSAFWSALKPTRDKFVDFGKSVIEVFGSFGQKITELNERVSSSDIFSKFLTDFKNFQIKSLSVLSKITSGFNSFLSVLKTVGQKIKEFAKSKLSGLSSGLRNVFQAFNMKQGLTLSGLLTAFFAGASIKRSLEIITYIKSALTNFKEFIWDFMGTIEDAFYAFGTSQSSSALLKVAAAIGILAVSLIALSSINPQALFFSFAVIAGAIGLLIGAFKSLTALSSLEGFNRFLNNLVITNLIKMAASLLIVAGALKLISTISPTQMWNSVGAISILFAELVAALYILSNSMKGFTGGLVKNAAKAMVDMGKSILILAAALKLISTIQPEALADPMLSVIILIGVMTAALSLLSNYAGKAKISAGALVGMAASILILAAAVKVFAGIDPGSLDTGLQAVIALLVTMTTLMALIGNFGESGATMLAAAGAMLIFSASMLVLGAACIFIGSAIDKAIDGFILIAGAIIVFGGLSAILGAAVAPMLGLGIALLVLSSAAVVFGFAAILIGSNAETIAIGLVVLAGALLLFGGVSLVLAAAVVPMLAVAAALLVLGAASIVGGAGMLVAGFALQVLGPALAYIGSNAGPVALALLLVAGAFVVLGAAGLVLTTVIPQILALSAALLLVAVACEIGASALRLLGISFGDAAGPIESGANGITSAIDTIPASLENLSNAGDGALNGLIESFSAGSVPVSNAAENMVSSAISSGSEAASGSTEIGDTMIVDLLSRLEAGQGEAGEAGSALSMEVITGMLSNESNATEAGATIGNSGIEGLSSTLGGFTTTGGDAGDGFIQGLLSKLGDANQAGALLGSAALQGTRSSIDAHSPAKEFAKLGVFSGEGYCGGIESMFRTIYGTSNAMGKLSLAALSDSLEKVSDFISSDPSYSPVITPVVDLSNIEAAGRSMGLYLGGRIPLSLGGSIATRPYSESNVEELIAVGYKILEEIQNGSDLYLDDGLLAGRINRRLGLKV